MTERQPNEASEYSRAPAILVVDDDTSICRYCSKALRNVGYQVVDTTSGLVALDHLRHQAFDLLLTDIKMPEMSGLELARQARALNPGLAVIIMTGQTTLETLREAVQQGVTSYLSKPFEIEEMRLTVAQVLHQRAMVLQKVKLEAIVHQLELSSAFNRTLSLSELCGEIVRVTNSEIGCQFGYFLLQQPDESPRLLMGQASHPQLNEAGWQLLQETYQQQQPIQTTLKLAEADHNVITFPLRVGGAMIGSALFDYTEALPSAQIEGMMLLLNQAAAALNNAQLFTRVQEANSRLQELDRLKSEFISITSHELRTPLAVVLGYGIVIQERSEPPIRTYLDRLVESAQRMKEIIDDMTHLRRLDTRQTELQVEPIVLDELLYEVIDQMHGLAQKKSQTLSLATPPDALCTLYADRAKIALVLMSLLSNAMKFTPAEGMITVRAWCETVQAVPYEHAYFKGTLQPGPWVFVSVSDSGIGIPESHLQRIFERFYQVAQSLTREYGGTGVGLALVQGLVALHNGHVWVQSEEGRGSTFTVALPQRGL
ncbi:MAG: response regulator [Chloroflexi bacterium]|nr:response regulator [Chloroflexota bacterium]